MQNKVVYTLARSFRRLGAHAVRFNFRGVGDSTGRFDEGIGETHDARAVIAWARRRWPGLPVYLAGFSFGAMVAFNASRQIGGLVLVAPPVTKYAFAPTAPACSWLVIQGDRDEIVSPAAVRRWCEAWRPPPTLIMIGGATHFFHGSLGKISDAVRNHFGSRLAVTDSGNGDHGC